MLFKVITGQLPIKICFNEYKIVAFTRKELDIKLLYIKNKRKKYVTLNV
jgi:hypothetical protein